MIHILSNFFLRDTYQIKSDCIHNKPNTKDIRLLKSSSIIFDQAMSILRIAKKYLVNSYGTLLTFLSLIQPVNYEYEFITDECSHLKSCCKIIFAFSLSYTTFILARLAITYFSNNTSIEEKPEEICKKIKADIRELKLKINKFDNFILSNKELNDCCREHIQWILNYSVLGDNPKPMIEKPNENSTQKITYLRIKEIRISRFLNERIRFIKSNKKLYNCFAKHFANSQNKNVDLKELI